MPSGKGTIAILTGGGDVPGLNPAIRAITIRALRENYRVVGIRRGWAGLVEHWHRRTQKSPQDALALVKDSAPSAPREAGESFYTVLSISVRSPWRSKP